MLTATLPLVLVIAALAPLDAASGCNQQLEIIGGCTNDGTQIIIDGEQTDPGNPGTSPIGNDGPGVGPWYPPAESESEFGACLEDWDDYIACFLALEEGDPEEAEDGEPAMSAVTIADLARFAPAGSVLAGEPANVGVAGLPTNFVATASVHTVSGSLFGFPIDVRFTPSAYDFSFGDGTTASSSTGGRTWESLGQPQFTPTDTSHTYGERGTYQARVDVRYTAEIDLGVGWFPIAGEITASGQNQEIRIFEAHTALVAHTCQQSPTSPGC